MVLETKTSALHILKGNWMKVVSLVLITYLLISLTGADFSRLSFQKGGLSFSPLSFSSSVNIVGIVLGSLLGSILFFAIVDMIYHLKHNRKKSYFKFFSYGFKNKTLIIKGFIFIVANRILQLIVAICIGGTLLNLTLMFDPIRAGVLLLISLVSGWLYLGLSQCMFILYDNPTVRFSKCLFMSISMMRRNKFKLIVLYISFIGWFSLGLIVFIVGVLWSIAYFKVSRFEFYEAIKS